MELFYIVLWTLLFCLIGYLMGNILFGSIFGKLNQTDIRAVGSHNVGATNVYRHLGFGIAFIVAFMDAMKAYLAVVFCWIIYRYTIYEISVNKDLYPLIFLAGTFAVIGHCFPIKYVITLFKFKFDLIKCKPYLGGKGVATAGATLFAISPWIALIAFAIWVLLVFFTKYVSLASMLCTTLTVPFIFFRELTYLYLFDQSLLFPEKLIITFSENIWLLLGICMVMFINTAILVTRHKDNIKRLITHTESKIWGKK